MGPSLALTVMSSSFLSSPGPSPLWRSHSSSGVPGPLVLLSLLPEACSIYALAAFPVQGRSSSPHPSLPLVPFSVVLFSSSPDTWCICLVFSRPALECSFCQKRGSVSFPAGLTYGLQHDGRGTQGPHLLVGGPWECGTRTLATEHRVCWQDPGCLLACWLQVGGVSSISPGGPQWDRRGQGSHAPLQAVLSLQ